MTAGTTRDDLPMIDHTTKAFDVDLRELTRMVADMGHLVEQQIADALDALTNRDQCRLHRARLCSPPRCSLVFYEPPSWQLLDCEPPWC